MGPLAKTAAAAIALSTMALLQGFGPAAEDGLVRIDGVAVAYRAAGEFVEGRLPVAGPLETIRPERPFSIMRDLVSRADYQACVDAGGCAALDRQGEPDRPVVGVNFDDATAYAAWLSARTGERWRLPTDREWALAAGSRYVDDGVASVSDPDNPARRWLAAYGAGSGEAGAADPAPQPPGSFGENEHGVADLAGNVWEWTSTCYVRHRVDPDGGASRTENCGIRVAEGRHRAYMVSFFRDPKAGACSVGIPPANLGIRLVRDDGAIDRLKHWLGV